MEPIVVGLLNTIARTVAPIAFSCQSKRIQKPSNKLYYGLVWSGVACVELHVSLPWHGGCGQQSDAEPAKSSPLPLETEAKRPVFGYGKPSRTNTNTAIPSVIFGMPINTCSRLKPIIVLGRKLGRLRIWNAGTTPCVNA